ncbi:MAG: tetratricopeptide repeat protein [Ignavibacteria bacterium]|nr:tetratricopeptide repeat protein [Ignavibacteria bacterium]
MKIIFILFCIASAYAQVNIDSLEIILKKSKGENKIKLLNDFADSLKDENPEQALTYAKEAHTLAANSGSAAEEVRSNDILSEIYFNLGKFDDAINVRLERLKEYESAGDKEKSAWTKFNIGLLYMEQNNFGKAEDFLTGALEEYEDINNRTGIGNCYVQLSIIYFQLNKLEKAAEFAFKCLKVREKIGEKQYLIDPLNILAVIYFSLEDYDKAAMYNSRAMELNIELDYKTGIANAYNVAGSIHSKQGSHEKALENFNAAYQVHIQMNSERGTAGDLGNLGNTYYDMKNYDEALKYYVKGLPLFEKYGDKYTLANTYKNIGGIYIKLNNLNEAEKNLLKGMQLAEEIGAQDLIKNSYDFLMELSEARGDYKSALKYQRLFNSLKDSVFNEENSKIIADLQTKYETEKKEQQIEILQKEKVIDRSLFISSSVVILLMITGIVIRMRVKRLIGIERIRAGIAADLHDDIGSGLVQISMFSEQINKKMASQSYMDDAVSASTLKVGNIARELIESMSDVVWSIDPKNDSLEKLLVRIEASVREICESENISFKLNVDGDASRIKPDLEILRSLLLITKEAVTNMIKHASAKELIISINVAVKKIIRVNIKDDGNGFDISGLKRINGINNMKKRIEKLGGKYDIHSAPGSGTEILLAIPVKKNKI